VFALTVVVVVVVIVPVIVAVAATSLYKQLGPISFQVKLSRSCLTFHHLSLPLKTSASQVLWHFLRHVRVHVNRILQGFYPHPNYTFPLFHFRFSLTLTISIHLTCVRIFRLKRFVLTKKKKTLEVCKCYDCKISCKIFINL